MAQERDKPPSNQAFLQKLDRQRLNKPCNRIIDLRGKVAGECQAYMFGGRTHYLDDRAYLLAKQLLDRFGGQYTVGVYESLHKALKTLNQQQVESVSTDNRDAEKEILKRDPTQPQLLSFDHFLQRKEARILYATSVDINIEDVLYHASTVDITTSSIRIALRRAHTLAAGDAVSVNFTALNESGGTNLLRNIPYRIIKVEHDEKRTYAILIRKRDDNQAVTVWLDNWTTQNTLSHLDLDDELANLASRYYLRLLIRTSDVPLLWLGQSHDPEPIKAFHLMPNGGNTLAVLEDKDTKANLSLLPIKKVIDSNTAYIVTVFNVDNKLKSIAVPRNQPNLVAKIINLHHTQQGSHILLLQTEKLQIDQSVFNTEMTFIAEQDKDYADSLADRLDSITQLLTITELSASCINTKPETAFSADEIEQYTLVNTWQTELPNSTLLRHHLRREEPRYFIRTEVTVHIDKQSFKVTTSEMSSVGMSVIIPSEIKLRAESRIKVDFTRWQKQTKEHFLNNIPYIVKNSSISNGETTLNLRRLTLSCSSNVNHFFESAIENNKAKLETNDHDVILGKEAAIFRSVFASTLSSIPFYLGMDADNKRILQAIATTNNNHASEYDSLWRALIKLVTSLSEQIKNQPNRDNSSVSFGLYCYQNKRQEWIINTDLDFISAAEKAFFISRALANEHYLFFHCSLMPIALNTLDGEVDLNEQLSQLRNQSAHKVKQIREILYSLFGMGNLTDITDVIEAVYK